MYFVDPSLHKNQPYYIAEIAALQEHLQIPIYLLYNGDFFQFLQGHTQSWELLLSSLYTWRKTAPEQINLNFDSEPEKTLLELNPVSSNVWYKLITTDVLWTNGVIKALFPNGKTLQLLETVFREQGGTKLRIGKGSITFLQLAGLLQLQLDKYYP